MYHRFCCKPPLGNPLPAHNCWGKPLGPPRILSAGFWRDFRRDGFRCLCHLLGLFLYSGHGIVYCGNAGGRFRLCWCICRCIRLGAAAGGEGDGQCRGQQKQARMLHKKSTPCLFLRTVYGVDNFMSTTIRLQRTDYPARVSSSWACMASGSKTN